MHHSLLRRQCHKLFLYRRLHKSICRSTSTPQVAWLDTIVEVPCSGQAARLRSDYDAVVILAGGQTDIGGVPLWVERRLDASHDIQKHQRSKSCPILCLGGGTPHKPPVLTPRGYVVHESTSCADYLLARGATADNILKESSSFDTVGNAYFSLVIHAIPAGWRRLAVVTSRFHMPRTQALFEEMYSLAAKSVFQEPDRFQLSFVSVNDDDLFDQSVLEARREKEAASTARWRAEAAKLGSLQDLHAWLHATHACYSVAQQATFDQPRIEDPRLLASY